jgi:hypothetical protein
MRSSAKRDRNSGRKEEEILEMKNSINQTKNSIKIITNRKDEAKENYQELKIRLRITTHRY